MFPGRKNSQRCKSNTKLASYIEVKDLFRIRIRRARCLVITMKGVEFAEKWYTAERIPSRLKRLYLLLIRLIWIKGAVTVNVARRLYGKEVLELASSRGYVNIYDRLRRPPEDVQNRIVEMIGDAPREIYA